MATVSWHRAQDSGETFQEKASSKEYHQLLLNHSVTGLLEITVEYLSSDCEKASSIEHTSEAFCKVFCYSLVCYIVSSFHSS